MILLGPALKTMIVKGRLTVFDSGGKRHEFSGSEPGSSLTLRFHRRSLPARLALRPDLALGEAYMDGSLTVEGGDIFDAMAFLMDNAERSGGFRLRRWGRTLNFWLRRLQQRNAIPAARRNVAHHYDLSSDLYEMFLDSDRQYSCAYYRSPDETLADAQRNKKLHIAAKLLLDRPGLKILDIGSGWGGLSLELARLSNANVTGVTLSQEQAKISKQRAAQSGLASDVQFRVQDYRAVDDKFDRIVSVGMFEHVGVTHYPEFFNKCRDLLHDDGVALLHTIGRSNGPAATGDWVRKYIFPGGYMPALSEVVPAIERAGLFITDIEILRFHYADTLRGWRRKFTANRDKVAELFDERFCRMWEFYLAASEAAFRYSAHEVFQIQFAKRKDTVPDTRDYVVDWERSHRARASQAA